MYKLTELIKARNLQAQELAQQLEPYLTTPEAIRIFNAYAHAVRERAEYQTIMSVLRSQGFNEAIDRLE